MRIYLIIAGEYSESWSDDCRSLQLKCCQLWGLVHWRGWEKWWLVNIPGLVPWLAASISLTAQGSVRNKNLVVASQRMLPAAQALNRKGTRLIWFTGINKNLWFARNWRFQFSSLAVRGYWVVPKRKMAELWNVLGWAGRLR